MPAFPELVTFDIFGTVLDWRSGMEAEGADAVRPLRVGAVARGAATAQSRPQRQRPSPAGGAVPASQRAAESPSRGGLPRPAMGGFRCHAGPLRPDHRQRHSLPARSFRTAGRDHAARCQRAHREPDHRPGPRQQRAFQQGDGVAGSCRGRDAASLRGRRCSAASRATAALSCGPTRGVRRCDQAFNLQHPFPAGASPWNT